MDIDYGKDKTPKYVVAYEKLHDMIVRGDFAATGKLPTEPRLAEKLGVSRMTLRQALALLNEDGLVQNVHGKGNFIRLEQKPPKFGIEAVGSPIKHCCAVSIDDMEIEFRIEPPNKHIQDVLLIKPSAVVVVDVWYRSSGNFVAYSLFLIPIETIIAFNIDLNNKTQLLRFVCEEVYSGVAYADIEVTTSTSGTFISDKYKISDKKHLTLILETLHDSNDEPLMHNKHYLLPDSSRVVIKAKRP